MLKNSNILMIRHAEKPDDPNDPTLSLVGKERAQAYIVYFQNFTVDSEVIELDYLFAAKESSGSNRPYLTLKHLAEALELSIDDKYKNKDYDELAKHISEHGKYDDSNILICWHHEHILPFAECLGAPASTLPESWPDDVFGWLLQLRFDSEGELEVLPAINQRLMYGDYGKEPS